MLFGQKNMLPTALFHNIISTHTDYLLLIVIAGSADRYISVDPF